MNYLLNERTMDDVIQLLLTGKAVKVMNQRPNCLNFLDTHTIYLNDRVI